MRALDLVVDGLADVVEQAAGLGDLDVGADLGRDDRREAARLDHVVEDVLAVARPVLEPAEELDQLRRQARDAALVGGGLAGLADDQVDLGAGLADDLLDPAGVDPAVADQLRQGHPGDLAADRVEARQDDRLGRVVDDQVDPGRLLEGPDVATLAADDPALHLVVREVDDGHRVLGGVVGGDPLDRGHDDVAGLLVGLLDALALDRAGELDGVVLGLLADGLEEDALRLIGGDAADPLERRDLLLVGAGEVLARLVEVALAIEQLPIALLEHVGPLVELLVALEEPALERGELVPLRARASSSASRCILSFSSLASRISSFWRARASASIRRASDWAAFIEFDANMPRATMPSTAPPTAATIATAITTGVSICTSRPAPCAGG